MAVTRADVQKQGVVIELSGVKKLYHLGHVEVKALNGVSISVSKGEFVSIIGKSGSGKSTLVNQIGCLDRPTEGKIYLDGRDISTLDENELARIRGRKIGFIFQTFNLIPTLTVFENITLPMVFQGVSEEQMRRKADNLIRLVELTERRNHKPSELSGGQRQRVAIARALANDPELILADEPTGNLDSRTGKQIIDLLMRLNSENKVTVIMVTHDEDIAMLAQRTIVLADGIVTEELRHSESERRAAYRDIEKTISELPVFDRKNGRKRGGNAQARSEDGRRPNGNVNKQEQVKNEGASKPPGSSLRLASLKDDGGQKEGKGRNGRNGRTSRTSHK